MMIQAVFSTGIGQDTDTEHLQLAREIFAENKELFNLIPGSGNFRTTLRKYSANTPNHLQYKNIEGINKIKNSIKEKTLKYLAVSGYKTQSLKVDVPNFWLNEMGKQGNHGKHVHYGYNVSGCYYVDVPMNSGKIQFHDVNKTDPCGSLEVNEYTPLNSESWHFTPKEGDMFFWKSTLQHEVIPSDFEGIRRSIAFDVLVTGI